MMILKSVRNAYLDVTFLEISRQLYLTYRKQILQLVATSLEGIFFYVTQAI
jgi:hypothetical protein